MAYKSVFTVLTDFDAQTPVLAKATDLARRFDAHLDVMCLGMDRSRSSYYEVGANAVIMEAAIKETHAKAEQVHAGVEKYLKKEEDVRWNAIYALGSVADIGRIAADAARFGDLAVVGQPYGADAGHDEVLLLEAMLFDAKRGTMIVPRTPSRGNSGTVVIGWNESAQSLRAIRCALPFLKAADVVHIAIIDPPEHGPDRSDPGGNLAVFLARHAVHCDIQVMSRSGGRVSERLNRHVTESGAGMLVMGAYGHSRFREAIMGGATRHMLEQATVPVLMAH
ncbi:MAG: universal stress protein [Pseudomonadota bacterium]